MISQMSDGDRRILAFFNAIESADAIVDFLRYDRDFGASRGRDIVTTFESLEAEYDHLLSDSKDARSASP